MSPRLYMSAFIRALNSRARNISGGGGMRTLTRRQFETRHSLYVYCRRRDVGPQWTKPGDVCGVRPKENFGFRLFNRNSAAGMAGKYRAKLGSFAKKDCFWPRQKIKYRAQGIFWVMCSRNPGLKMGGAALRRYGDNEGKLGHLQG